MTQKVDEGKLEVVAAQIEKSLPEVEAMPVTVAVAIAQDPKIVDPMVQSRQKESVSVSAPTVAIKGGPNLHIVTYGKCGTCSDC